VAPAAAVGAAPLAATQPLAISNSIYSAFACLPEASDDTASGGAGKADLYSVCREGVPMHLQASADEEPGRRQQPAAFAIAHEVLAECDHWTGIRTAEEQRRTERRELMHVACLPPVVHPTPAVDEEACLREVMSASGLSRERCLFYLQLHEWDVDKAMCNIAEVLTVDDVQPTAQLAVSSTPPAAPLGVAKGDEVTLEFHLPDGKMVAEYFRITAGGFDVYAKAYDLLPDKEKAFTMSLSGPREGATVVAKELDEGTWSFNLQGLGVWAGGIYEIKVVQVP